MLKGSNLSLMSTVKNQKAPSAMVELNSKSKQFLLRSMPRMVPPTIHESPSEFIISFLNMYRILKLQ